MAARRPAQMVHQARFFAFTSKAQLNVTDYFILTQKMETAMKLSLIPTAMLFIGASNVTPAAAGQQRLNQVYWVSSTTCAVLAQPRLSVPPKKCGFTPAATTDRDCICESPSAKGAMLSSQRLRRTRRTSTVSHFHNRIILNHDSKLIIGEAHVYV